MTDTLMDIDDLKVAWQRLDRKLDRQNALAFEHFKDGRVRTMRARLRPLLLGQAAQCVIGAGLVVFAVRTWLTHWDHSPLRTAGLVMHVYGVLVIIAGARTVHLIRQIDYAAPVLALQRQLAELRAWYVRTGTAIGLAWWFLWMPFMMMLVALAGVDMWTRAPGVFSLGTAIGVAGLLVMWGLQRWAQRPGWAWLAASHEAAMTGASLRRAAAVLDEIRRFETEPADEPPAPAR
jgi:hypothetical protein